MNFAVRKAVRGVMGTLARRRVRFATRIGRESPGRIAYFVAGGIGDGIMALPAVRSLRKSYSSARIDVILPRQVAHILKLVYAGEKTGLLVWGREVFDAVRRCGRYDIALTNFVAGFRVSAEIVSRAAARQTAGFRYRTESSSDRIYDVSIPMAEGMHESEQNLLLLEQCLGIKTENPGQGPDRFRPVREGPREVVIHPGAAAGYERKRWPVDRFRELARELTQAWDHVTFLLGPAESSLEKIGRGLENVWVVSSPSGRDLMTLLSGADLFIGTDSGPAHLAAHLGAACVVLFGPVDPVRAAPRGAPVEIVYNPFDCSPCHDHDRNCGDNRCMASITVNQVLDAVARLERRREGLA